MSIGKIHTLADYPSLSQEGLHTLLALFQENLQLGSNISERYHAIESTCKAQNALLATLQAENQLLKRQVVDLVSTNADLKQKNDTISYETKEKIEENNHLNDIKLQAQKVLLNSAKQEIQSLKEVVNNLKIEKEQINTTMQLSIELAVNSCNEKHQALHEISKIKIEHLKKQCVSSLNDLASTIFDKGICFFDNLIAFRTNEMHDPHIEIDGVIEIEKEIKRDFKELFSYSIPEFVKAQTSLIQEVKDNALQEKK